MHRKHNQFFYATKKNKHAKKNKKYIKDFLQAIYIFWNSYKNPREPDFIW